MKGNAIVVGKFAALALLGVLRFVTYVMLRLAGGIVQPLASLGTGMGLLLFLFCFFLRRDLTTPMWAGAGLAAASMAVLVLYQGALQLVAPAGSVIVSDV